MCPQLGQDIGSGDRCFGRFVALVSRRPAGASQCLFQGVGGEDTKPNRQPSPHRNLAQPAGCFSRHEIEVRGFSTDDRAQRHDGDIFSGRCRRRCRTAKLERARQPHHIYILLLHASLPAAGQRPFEQLAGDDLVIVADQHRHSAGGAKPPAKFWHANE